MFKKGGGKLIWVFIGDMWFQIYLGSGSCKGVDKGISFGGNCYGKYYY